MIIGLTGKSCSGKNRVAELLDKDLFSVIDEDRLGHMALSFNKDRIKEVFGAAVIGADGEVDRKKLGPIVFSSEENIDKLNSISHPWMVDETLRLAREIEASGKIAVINAAILEKMGLDKHCDEFLFVLSSYEKREERALRRDGTTKEAFKNRSLSQTEIGQSLFSSGKRVVTIINNDTEDALSRQIENYCATIKK